MYNNMEENYEMIPFEIPNYMYTPRMIEPIVEDLSFMTRSSEEEETKVREKDKKYKDKDYYDNDYKDKDYYDKDYPKYDYRDIQRICRMIERYNPGIIRTMVRYGMPYPVARRLCRRIVRLTLRYYYY
ncbi:hypothetical protein [Clostridium ganghwense]|uniref:Uncharacterized protein n=1 Tax=Clostridium ganghwense TaxID=312089 RepID=A0ABT4CKM1_9CLOT|nr:hypothetical protein [Clostridium ganghwense]MCY6369592.1 hypothetical protein [Clostridium ganghwense]